MNAKAAICLALLKGDTLNVKNCFSKFGVTNCAREIGRCVEKPFDVIVSRVNMEGKTRYGIYCCWTDYHLNRTEYNSEGVKKMLAYVHKQLQPEEKEQLNKKQPELF